MSSNSLFVSAAILISLFTTWIWIEYYRDISIFNRKPWLRALPFLGAGILAFFLYAPLYEQIIAAGIVVQGAEDILSRAWFSLAAIALPQELLKGLPVLAFMYWKRREEAELMDYLIFTAMTALGFATAQNIMFAMHQDLEAYLSRIMLSSMNHVVDSSIWIYGFILMRFENNNRDKNILMVLLYMIFAGLTQAFCNYWFLEGNSFQHSFISFQYFIINISAFATILNNGLNHSSGFTFKKALDTATVQNKLVRNYFYQWLAISVLISLRIGDFSIGLILFVAGLGIYAPLLIIVFLRLTRFSLQKQHWLAVLPELPLMFRTGGSGEPGMGNLLAVRGSSINEEYMAPFYEELCMVCPWTPTDAMNWNEHVGYIFEKRFMKWNETYYHARLYKDESGTETKNFLLYTRKKGTLSTYKDDYPICALLEYDIPESQLNANMGTRDFAFRAWVYLRPLTDEERSRLQKKPAFAQLLQAKTD